MNYQARVRPSGAMPRGGGYGVAQNQTVSGGIQTGFQLGGNATGPAFVLIGIFVLYAFSASGRQRADEDAELRERLARIEGRLQLD